eukprot:TRINITY_DN4657_c0_g2_i1.p1 TRINITY_DN4657_c0_g2~~TRINITY_DN4657_c0_g2_i1.p1  ORF type:complete len:133 (+),score=26.84 TRINITY_DN4657_c0_g2_i1:47-445(+)
MHVVSWLLSKVTGSGRGKGKKELIENEQKVRKLEGVVQRQKKEIKELKTKLRVRRKRPRTVYDMPVLKEAFEKVRRARENSPPPVPTCFTNTANGVKCPACSEILAPSRVVEHYSKCPDRKEGLGTRSDSSE